MFSGLFMSQILNGEIKKREEDPMCPHLRHKRQVRWACSMTPMLHGPGGYSRPEHDKGAINMIRQSDHRLSISISGPESNPAGAVSGRAATNFHPIPFRCRGRITGRQQPSLHLAPGCASAAGDRLPPAFSGVPATILNPQRQQRQTSGLLRASP